MQRNPGFHHKLFKFHISLNILDYIANFGATCMSYKVWTQMDSQITLPRECKMLD